jgi:hypothetical protein
MSAILACPRHHRVGQVRLGRPGLAEADVQGVAQGRAVFWEGVEAAAGGAGSGGAG